LLAYLNVHYLIFLSMVHEYAYKTYEYISKLANFMVHTKTDTERHADGSWRLA